MEKLTTSTIFFYSDFTKSLTYECKALTVKPASPDSSKVQFSEPS